jgi:2,5-diamino-6-(ribosylamino)-4(3H)-pyrimidinone 5'-phosphate reductase
MLPKVVVYNSVSVDGAIKDFDVNIALHYKVAGRIDAQAILIGSDTAKSGIDMFLKTIPEELRDDFVKPTFEESDSRPYWAIADSRAKLKGLLHVYRQSGYCKDVIVLVSKITSKDYLEYLQERNYDYIVTGTDHVDYRAALEELYRRYEFNTIVTDTGGILASILLENGLVSEVQLFVAPQIIGKNAVPLFRSLNHPINVKLMQTKSIRGHALLVYRVQAN